MHEKHWLVPLDRSIRSEIAKKLKGESRSDRFLMFEYEYSSFWSPFLKYNSRFRNDLQCEVRV